MTCENGLSSDWEQLRSSELVKKCLVTRSRPSCGKILAHAKNQITSMRETMGIRICIFKIGVTSNPKRRFEWYLERGYSCMWVLAESDSQDLIHMLEAALISEFGKHIGCRNKPDSGGEGALNRTTVASCPPFYTYVVGGRADQSRWVGWSLLFKSKFNLWYDAKRGFKLRGKRVFVVPLLAPTCMSECKHVLLSLFFAFPWWYS